LVEPDKTVFRALKGKDIRLSTGIERPPLCLEHRPMPITTVPEGAVTFDLAQLSTSCTAHAVLELTNTDGDSRQFFVKGTSSLCTISQGTGALEPGATVSIRVTMLCVNSDGRDIAAEQVVVESRLQTAGVETVNLAVKFKGEAPADRFRLDSNLASEPPLTAVRDTGAAEIMNGAHRQTMEDAHVDLDGFGGAPGRGFYAVFDGHGGRQTVDYIEKHLHTNLAALLADGKTEPKEALETAFTQTDREMATAVDTENSGATGVCVLLNNNADGSLTLDAANAGDSRAILTRPGPSPLMPVTAERLTFDHKPSNADEKARVEAAGGFVFRNRVMGVLAVSRAFGDKEMKELVIADPYTYSTTLDAAHVGSSFLIVACDGVFDVLSDAECVACVWHHYLSVSGRLPVVCACCIHGLSQALGS
jgi:serine/threonine protein phosphatase PrpC